MRKKLGENITCKACLKEFYVPKYRIKTAKFCSLECQNHKQYEKWVYNCQNCKKKCIESPSRKNYRKKFCSIDCFNAKRKTDKERRAQIKSYNILKRGNNSSRRLRVNFFKLKKPVCEICGYDEHDFCIDLHHIDENCENNEIENIAMLCAICHRKLHKNFITNEDIYAARKRVQPKHDQS